MAAGTPYGQWALDEVPAIHGSTLVDTGSGQNYGTLSTSDGATDKSVVGKIGRGISFDGVDDWINVANEANFDFNLQSFTVMGWVKAVTAQGPLAAKGGVSDVGGWQFRVSPTTLGGLLFNASGSNVVVRETSATQPFNDGNWHHVAAVIGFDTVTAGNNTVTLYVDGQPVSMTNTGAGGTPVLNNKTLQIGTREDLAGSHAIFFQGQMDDVRIYNAAVIAADILAIYQDVARPLFRGV